jgi:hypothetical protein
MKYVMAEVSQGSLRRSVPCVFPNELVHVVMASYFKQALEHHGYTDVEFVSAGEVTLFGAGVECSGSSETLKLSARESDARTIEMYDYLHGV